MRKKLLLINKCNQCLCYNDSWGFRCFHPEMVEPHPEGVIPKEIVLAADDKLYSVAIPNWCPLADATTV